MAYLFFFFFSTFTRRCFVFKSVCRSLTLSWGWRVGWPAESGWVCCAAGQQLLSVRQAADYTAYLLFQALLVSNWPSVSHQSCRFSLWPQDLIPEPEPEFEFSGCWVHPAGVTTLIHDGELNAPAAFKHVAAPVTLENESVVFVSRPILMKTFKRLRPRNKR